MRGALVGSQQSMGTGGIIPADAGSTLMPAAESTPTPGIIPADAGST